MKLVDNIEETASERVFWVIQTIFGFIIGRSFYDYASAFVPPFEGDILTLTLGIFSVYVFVIWSWLDFSYTLVVSPYHFRQHLLEKLRFVADLLIVLAYSYLLIDLAHINKHPEANIGEFFWTFGIIFVGYILSGLLRIAQYGRRASRLKLIVLFFLIYSFVAWLYGEVSSVSLSVCTNRIFIIVTIAATFAYRTIRSLIASRRHTIAVDVDGVLANQIHNTLPIIKEKHGIDLKYERVTDWKLPIGDTDIAKIIVEAQEQRSFILEMPIHPGAKEAVQRIIQKHKIAIATARAPNSDTWTKEWLNTNGISFDSFHNSKEGQKQNASIHFDLLIDDYLGNIEQFLIHHKKGVAILFSQPWNQDRTKVQTYLDQKRLHVATSWDQIPSMIQTALKV